MKIVLALDNTVTNLESFAKRYAEAKATRNFEAVNAIVTIVEKVYTQRFKELGNSPSAMKLCEPPSASCPSRRVRRCCCACLAPHSADASGRGECPLSISRHDAGRSCASGRGCAETCQTRRTRRGRSRRGLRVSSLSFFAQHTTAAWTSRAYNCFCVRRRRKLTPSPPLFLRSRSQIASFVSHAQSARLRSRPRPPTRPISRLHCRTRWVRASARRRPSTRPRAAVQRAAQRLHRLPAAVRVTPLLLLRVTVDEPCCGIGGTRSAVRRPNSRILSYHCTHA